MNDLISGSKKLVIQLFESYYIKKEIDTALSLVSPNITWIGTSKEGIIRNKKELETAFYESQNDMKCIHFAFYDLQACERGNNYVEVFGEIESRYRWLDKDIFFSTFRFTAGCHKVKEDNFLVDVLHTSVSTKQPAMEMGMLHSLPGGIYRFICDDILTIIYANEYSYTMLGYTLEQARMACIHSIAAIAVPEDFIELKNCLNMRKKDNQNKFEFELRVKNRKQETLWFLLKCSSSELNPEYVTCVFMDITKRKNNENQLQLIEEENRLALTLHAGKSVMRYDFDTNTISHSQMSSNLFNAQNFKLESGLEFLFKQNKIEKKCEKDFQEFFSSMLDGKQNGSCAIQIRSVDNNTLPWYRFDYTLIFKADGHTPSRAIISYEDITEEREKEIAFEKWNQSYETLRKESIAYYEYNLSQDIFEDVDGPLSYVLPPKGLGTFTNVAKYASKNLIPEDEKEQYLKIFSREFLINSYYEGKREIEYEHRRLSPDGNSFYALATIQLLADPYSGDIKGFVLIRNIDQNKRNELELKKRSQLDPLTSLYNRRTTVEEIDNIIKQSNPNTQHAFVMFDIDGFKQLNDTLGHLFGDQVLMDIAKNLKLVLRGDDIVGRIGGDEFIICLKGMPYSSALKERLKELSNLLKKEFVRDINISASIGVSMYPKDGTSFLELYHNADIAMYRAKKTGKDKIKFFE